MTDIFLLTKPPASPRAKLCLKMVEASGDAALYLFGDGVYNVLGEIIHILSPEKVYACREDLDARGLPPGDEVTVPEEFYGSMVREILERSDKVYSF